MMIYEPKGRALEYSPLACNLAVGCTHNCRYCYGPGAFRVDPNKWNEPRFKADVVSKYRKDAAKLINDPREILFSFASDPYMNQQSADIMKQILPIAEQCRHRVQVLTKNPRLALDASAAILKRNDWKLGTTLIFLSEKLREEWEPGAPTIEERFRALKEAHDLGIKTWVSIEPVVDIDEALAAISAVKPHADFIKVGKLNNHRLQGTMDWRYFLTKAREVLGNHPHLIKHDLKAFE
jgi:DNA repair photolyase